LGGRGGKLLYANRNMAQGWGRSRGREGKNACIFVCVLLEKPTFIANQKDNRGPTSNVHFGGVGGGGKLLLQIEPWWEREGRL
jgi:hypothetical protein